MGHLGASVASEMWEKQSVMGGLGRGVKRELQHVEVYTWQRGRGIPGAPGVGGLGGQHSPSS